MPKMLWSLLAKSFIYDSYIITDILYVLVSLNNPQFYYVNWKSKLHKLFEKNSFCTPLESLRHVYLITPNILPTKYAEYS